MRVATVEIVAKYSNTREVLARAALAHIDEHGLESLSLRTLGKAIGLHHTAVYKHFDGRDDVLAAAMAIVLDDALAALGDLPSDPRERLEQLCLGMRAAMRAHPGMPSIALLPNTSIGESAAVVQFQGLVLKALRDVGLRGHQVALHYRLLEGYVVGLSAFDFAGAPQHLTSRQQRYREVGAPELSDASDGPCSVAALNEEAFQHGLRLLLDSCQRAGAPDFTDAGRGY